MKAWIIRFACVSLFVVVAPNHEARAEGIFSDGGPDAGTPEYYEYYRNSPVGSRQKYYKGKVWPPRPRPCGPHQPFAHKYHTATYWPWPYVCQDRALVRSTSLTQIENGWITATTLYDFHFDPETAELNTSGRKQLQWILTHVPEDYLRLYIAADFRAEINKARTNNLQQELANMAIGQPMPIAMRVAQPLTRSAIVVEQIDRVGFEAIPAPTIQYTGIGGGG